MNRKSIVTLVTMVILSISSFAETSTNTLKVPLTIENKKTALPNDFTSQLPAVTTFDNVITKKYGDVKLHTFQSVSVSTVVIENDKLTIIDYPGDSEEQAAKFKKYIESLNKPIDRIILSHRDNSHWLGIDKIFPNVPLYSVDADEIHAKPEGIALPVTKIADNSTQVIDGIKYEFVTNRDINAWEIKLPAQKAVFIEHIGYVNRHILNAPIDARLKLLQELNKEGYTWYMPGHGAPMKAPEFVNQVTAYYTDILKAPTTYKSAVEAKAKIMAKYPDYTGEAMLERYLNALYK